MPGMAPLTLTAATGRVSGRNVACSANCAARCAAGGLPDPRRPRSAPPGVWARLAVGAGAALVLIGMPLLADANDVLRTVEVGGWRWLGGALALTILARAAMAGSELLTVDRRLALGRTFGATMVADSATLLHGRLGWRRATARFLERAGVLRLRGAGERPVVAGNIAAAVVVAVGDVPPRAGGGPAHRLGTPEALVPPCCSASARGRSSPASGWPAGRSPHRARRRCRGPAARHADPADSTRRTGTRGASERWPWWPQVAWSVLGVAWRRRPWPRRCTPWAARCPSLPR